MQNRLVERILRGLSRFQESVYPEHRDLFKELALGQRPLALFITCSDSRIDPAMLTQAKPGELFICRVIGNIIPRYPNMAGGVTATLEYAAGVLRVPDIIVCGHTDCGVMKGALRPETVESLPAVSSWLANVQPARATLSQSGLDPADPAFLLALTERNVVEQLNNLQTHPSVMTRLNEGSVRIHGWVYHIAEGVVTAYDASTRQFVQI